MQEKPTITTVPANASANKRVAAGAALMAVTMIGAAYAAVPLYDLFCRVTGYGGTTNVATAASDTVLDKTIKIRFDASKDRGFGWEFKPLQTEMTLKIGEETRFGCAWTDRQPFAGSEAP